MIAILAISLAIIYLVINFVAVFVRNYKAHKFFETKSPKLPVVPNPGIFGGHLQEVLAPWKNWKIIDDLHKKHGPTFGYYIAEQPWVSTKDIDLIKLIKVDAAHKHMDRLVFGLPFNEVNNSIFQVNGDRWRQVRRVVAPALTNHKVRGDEVSSDIESVVAQLAASMERRSKKSLSGENAGQDGKSPSSASSFVVEIRDLFERYALAVILLITYKQTDLVDFDSDQDSWCHEFNLGARDIPNPVIHASMMFPFLRPLCNFLAQFHSSGKLQIKVSDYIIKATDINRMARELHTKREKRMSLTIDGYKERSFSEVKAQGLLFKRRLVDTIIDAFVEKKIKYKNFIGSLLFLLLAGFLTTADTISSLVWQLSKHPDIQEKLRKIILEKGMDDEYVIWCIYETIRLNPAVPLGAGRVLGEDVLVNGQFLAKGTFVMTSAYSIHHDPKIWPEPERFNPDRWRDQANFHPAAFVGFGLGPRNCVGGKLAIHEIKLVIRMLLANYRIESCEQTPDQLNWSSPGMFYTLNDEPIMIRFNPLARVEASAA